MRKALVFQGYFSCIHIPKTVPRIPVVLAMGGIGALIFCLDVLVLDVALYIVFTHSAKCAHVVTGGQDRYFSYPK